jgi:hypothetical protein
METIAIKTQLGILNYRDTIIVKLLETSVLPLNLTIIGTIDGNQCSIKTDDRNIPFNLNFNSIIMFNCFKLDYSLVDVYTKSSFDEVINSALSEKMKLLNSHKHFIVSTYDYVFEVIATDYELQLI